MGRRDPNRWPTEEWRRVAPTVAKMRAGRWEVVQAAGCDVSHAAVCGLAAGLIGRANEGAARSLFPGRLCARGRRPCRYPHCCFSEIIKLLWCNFHVSRESSSQLRYVETMLRELLHRILVSFSFEVLADVSV